MSNNFRVGQKVVCVDDRWETMDETQRGKPSPFRGRVCTVAAKVSRYRETYLVLAEFSPDSGFLASRFRPAVDKPASIEVFRKMLVPSEGVNA